MKYKIISNNNVVTFKMRTGKDLVRSQMGIAYAQSIIARAKEVIEKDDEIIVDDTYFFPIEPTKKKKAEEVTDNE
jgi:uncharacterized Zn finger protein